MEIQIRESNPGDVVLIMRNLRETDKEVFGRVKGAEDALLTEMKQSNVCYSGFIDGEIACLWGVKASSLVVNKGYVWLVGTKLMEEHPFVFVRHSQMILDDLKEEFGEIYGFVLTDNARSIKWLKWLGFELLEAPDNLLVFEMKRWPTQ